VRFRNNRLPYIFPAWLGDEPIQMQLKGFHEFTGTVVEDLDDRRIIEIDRECLLDDSPPIRIEWLKECTEVLEP
jgi:hypothetical protein